ncbi:cysteine-rich receptor-like protein kinase 8, partial [Tanacetum coccineum]
SGNYSSWKRSIMIALNEKNKMKLITGEFPLWNELQEHYAQIDDHRIFQLTNDMVQLKQDNCSVEVYYQKLKGLDEGYSNIRGKILLMLPLPSAAKAYIMVRQKEKQRETSNPKHQTSTILNSYTNQSRPSTSNSQRYNSPRQPIPNNNSNRRNNVNLNTSYNRRSAFKKGVYYENYGKEVHYQEECYKIVRYIVGHPLHGKYQPPKVTRPTQDNRPPRIINMAIGQVNSRPQASLIPQNSS